MLCMCYPKIFNSNNFAIIAALSEECALQSTILSVHLLSRITFRRRLAAQYYDFLWKASTEGDIAKWCGENIPYRNQMLHGHQTRCEASFTWWTTDAVARSVCAS